MAIIVLMSSLGVVAVLNYQRNAQSQAAAIEISTLKKQCTAYKLNVGVFPSKLEAPWDTAKWYATESMARAVYGSD
ncbi:MAG: type II secretion system protein GspG [Pirellulaceae bacterium]